MDLDERARRCRDYMEALEEESRKIMVFQRELPLCLQLVTQAIESCKQQMGCEDASSDGGPVLAEFIPLKPSSTGTGTGTESESEESCRQDDKPVEEEILDRKPDWLRSVQLWNQEPEPLPKRDHPRKPVAVNARKLGGAFHPFEKEKHALLVDRPTPAMSSTAETTITGGVGGAETDKDKEKEGQSLQSNRKARRCWSPELHRRFLHALQQLGGSHAATPKQIRELMKVDGLTNDEVKSHLQKYRLHTRRPTATVQSSNNDNPQAPHFVVVGGIWVAPPEYAAAAAAAVAAATAQPTEATGPPRNGIYAPVASLPSEFRSQHQQNKQSIRSPNAPLHSDRRCSQDDSSIADNGASNSASPTSSSSQTITASPPNDA